MRESRWLGFVAWANVVVAAVEGWTLLAGLPASIAFTGVSAILVAAVQLLRILLTIVAGLGTLERKSWARLGVIYVSVVNLALFALSVSSLIAHIAVSSAVGYMLPAVVHLNVPAAAIAVVTIVVLSRSTLTRSFPRARRADLIAVTAIAAAFTVFHVFAYLRAARRFAAAA